MVGLEELLITDDDRPRSTRAIATLNFNRDLLRERLALPVVLWLSQRAARAFALLATDTFDIVRTTFELDDTDQEEVVKPLVVLERPPRWLRPAPEAERPQLEVRQRTLEILHAEAAPKSAAAADFAASIASVALALEREDVALEWLARAAREHEDTGSLGAAATDLRRRAELLAYRGRMSEATEEIESAMRLVTRVTGTDDPSRC